MSVLYVFLFIIFRAIGLSLQGSGIANPKVDCDMSFEHD